MICAASEAGTPRSSSTGAWCWREVAEAIRGCHFPGQPVFADKPRTADVTVGDKIVSGEIVNVSDYLITLKRGDGSVVSFARNGARPSVTIHDPLQAHLDMLPKWTDRNMHDVTAYLVTIK